MRQSTRRSGTPSASLRRASVTRLSGLGIGSGLHTIERRRTGRISGRCRARRRTAPSSSRGRRTTFHASLARSEGPRSARASRRSESQAASSRSSAFT
ncbi:MAG TPA: hypothetical protein DEF51_38385 [Myxococcales bacterium]|nr:hypothetical protein [Myxococcales bacterium]